MENSTAGFHDTWELFNNVNDIFKWIILIPIVLSIFGNTTTILVMRLPRNKNTVSGFLFLSLAVSDIIVTLMTPVERWVMFMFHIGLYQFHVVGVIKNGLTIANGHISSWLLVIITIERALSVFIPLKVKSVCTLRRMKCVVLGMVVTMLTIDLIGALLLTDFTTDSSNFPIPIDKVEDGILIFSLTDLLLGFTIPFCIILVGSICILIKLKRRKMAKYSEQSKVLISVTMNLLAANLLFLVTTAPFTINAYLNDFNPEYYVAWNVIWLLVDLNAALNFFVYVLSGSRFREDVKQIFGCRTTSP